MAAPFISKAQRKREERERYFSKPPTFLSMSQALGLAIRVSQMSKALFVGTYRAPSWSRNAMNLR